MCDLELEFSALLEINCIHRERDRSKKIKCDKILTFDNFKYMVLVVVYLKRFASLTLCENKNS